MLKQLLFKNILGFTLIIMSCSFIYFNDMEHSEISKNQISCGSETFNLHFGGLEESGYGNWLNIPTADHFKTNIFLSDVDLNDATINTSEKIVLQLSNYTAGNDFKCGQYEVRAADYKLMSGSESIVKAKLLYLEGENEAPKVVSGKIKYDGEYPELSIEFTLRLENGEQISGNFYRGLEDFKYFF